MSDIVETQVNIVSEGSRLEGKLFFDQVTRVHGTIVGEVHSSNGSALFIGESGVIEGKIFADHLWIDGYVRGELEVINKVVISSTGRVVGNIRTSKIEVEFGAFFEGDCSMRK